MPDQNGETKSGENNPQENLAISPPKKPEDEVKVMAANSGQDNPQENKA